MYKVEINDNKMKEISFEINKKITNKVFKNEEIMNHIMKYLNDNYYDKQFKNIKITNIIKSCDKYYLIFITGVITIQNQEDQNEIKIASDTLESIYNEIESYIDNYIAVTTKINNN